MSEQARAIWKDDAVATELIVVITKPEQMLTTTAHDPQCDIVYHRCGGASQLSGQEDKAVCCYPCIAELARKQIRRRDINDSLIP